MLDFLQKLALVIDSVPGGILKNQAPCTGKDFYCTQSIITDIYNVFVGDAKRADPTQGAWIFDTD